MGRRSEVIGLALAGYCVANGAFVATVAKLTTSAAQPLSIAFLTSAFGGLAVLMLLAARGKLGLLAVRRDLPALLAVGALGTALAFLLFYSGAKRVTAVETALCVQTEPLYALLGTRVLLGHPLTAQRVAAVAAIGAGIALAIGTQPTSGWLGLALLLATPLAWQSSHWVALRALPVFDPLQLAGARYVFGTLVLLPLWLAVDGPAGFPAGDELRQLLPVVARAGCAARLRRDAGLVRCREAPRSDPRRRRSWCRRCRSCRSWSRTWCSASRSPPAKRPASR